MTTGNSPMCHSTTRPFVSGSNSRMTSCSKVLSSTAVLGNITLDVVFAMKQFTVQNPKLTQAFAAAQEEANAYIARDRKGAAETFLRISKIKLTQAEVEAMLADPDNQFSTTPVGMMQYVDFMGLAGTIKTRPKAWSELFIDSVKSRKGS